jgi:hypothetical protein
MAANKKQGQWFALFLIGLTVACAGIAGYPKGLGMAALVIGLLILAVSFWSFLKIKPLEGKVALGAQPAAMKALGVLVTIAGWLVVLFGLHLAAGIAGRLILTLVGMAISLVGVLGILPAACNKNAIWKA